MNPKLQRQRVLQIIFEKFIIEMFMVEKFIVEKIMVEMFMIEKFIVVYCKFRLGWSLNSKVTGIKYPATDLKY